MAMAYVPILTIMICEYYYFIITMENIAWRLPFLFNRQGPPYGIGMGAQTFWVQTGRKSSRFET